jgi:hypothetical protein
MVRQTPHSGGSEGGGDSGVMWGDVGVKEGTEEWVSKWADKGKTVRSVYQLSRGQLFIIVPFALFACRICFFVEITFLAGMQE